MSRTLRPSLPPVSAVGCVVDGDWLNHGLGVTRVDHVRRDQDRADTSTIRPPGTPERMFDSGRLVVMTGRNRPLTLAFAKSRLRPGCARRNGQDAREAVDHAAARELAASARRWRRLGPDGARGSYRFARSAPAYASRPGPRSARAAARGRAAWWTPADPSPAARARGGAPKQAPGHGLGRQRRRRRARCRARPRPPASARPGAEASAPAGPIRRRCPSRCPRRVRGRLGCGDPGGCSPRRRRRPRRSSRGRSTETARASGREGSNGTQPMPVNQTSTQECASRSRTRYSLGVLVVRAGREAGRHAGRDGHAEHQRHRARELLAVAALVLLQEAHQRVGMRGNPLRVPEVVLEPGLDALDGVVGGRPAAVSWRACSYIRA